MEQIVHAIEEQQRANNAAGRYVTLLPNTDLPASPLQQNSSVGGGGKGFYALVDSNNNSSFNVNAHSSTSSVQNMLAQAGFHDTMPSLPSAYQQQQQQLMAQQQQQIKQQAQYQMLQPLHGLDNQQQQQQDRPKSGLHERRLKIDTKPRQLGGADKVAASPVLRRRNNYTTGDFGPAFNPTVQHENVLTGDSSASVAFNVAGRVDKGFFLAGSDWACYRRNYFQASGAFTAFVQGPHGPIDYDASGEVPCVLQLGERYLPIVRYTMGISAASGEGQKAVPLVQHTSKRDKGPTLSPCCLPVRCGGNVLHSQLPQLMVSSPIVQGGPIGGIGAPMSVVTFERIQFKSATANNGKRRAAQQYYVVSLDLYAEVTDESGEGMRSVKIASATSSSLVVRGRSPGHYADSDSEVFSPHGGSSYTSSPIMAKQPTSVRAHPYKVHTLQSASAAAFQDPYSPSRFYAQRDSQLSTLSLDMAAGRLYNSSSAMQNESTILPPLSAHTLNRLNGFGADSMTLQSPSAYLLNSRPTSYLAPPSASLNQGGRDDSPDTPLVATAPNSAPSLFSTGSSNGGYSPLNDAQLTAMDGNRSDLLIQQLQGGTVLSPSLQPPSSASELTFAAASTQPSTKNAGNGDQQGQGSSFEQFPEVTSQFDSGILPF